MPATKPTNLAGNTDPALSTVTLPKDSNGYGMILEVDGANTGVVPSGNYVKNAGGLWVPVSNTDPMPTKVTGSNVSQTNGATAATASTLVAGKDASGNGVPIKVASDGTVATSTTATATFNDKHEVLVTRQTDMAGKVQGQTYDVPHAMYTGPTDITTAPSAGGWTENSTANHAAIATQGDGSTATVSRSTNGAYALQRFAFDLLTIAKRTPGIPSNWTVTDLKNNIKNLTLTWAGYGVGANGGAPANGATLETWRDDTSAWVSFGTPHTATSPTSISGSVSGSSLVSRIDTNGFFHALAHATYASDGVNPSTIFTDYIKVEFTLIASQLNDAPVSYVDEQNIGQVTVTAGASTQFGSSLDISRCEAYGMAVATSASHTYKVEGTPLGRDSVSLITAAADRDTIIASAAQQNKLSPRVNVRYPRVALIITNSDASDRTYYGRFFRYGIRGARLS